MKPYLDGGSGDVIKVQDLLSKLKLDIARFDSTNPIATNCDQQELLLARETLELAAIFSVQLKDIGSFERLRNKKKNEIYFEIDFSCKFRPHNVKFSLQNSFFIFISLPFKFKI